MKIEHDLRCAIRSAEKVQRNRDNYQARSEREQNAISSLLKRDKKARNRINAATSKVKLLSNLLTSQYRIIASYGLSGNDSKTTGLYVSDEVKFKASGGEIPQAVNIWTSDQIIAELAKANAKEGAAILARIGIKWD